MYIDFSQARCARCVFEAICARCGSEAVQTLWKQKDWHKLGGQLQLTGMSDTMPTLLGLELYPCIVLG